MSKHARHDISELEKHVLNQIPLRLEHVPDEETQAWDAWLHGSLVVGKPNHEAIGWTGDDHKTRVELKTATRWIDARGSNGDRRRGRFFIGKSSHEELLNLGGLYLLVVLNDDREILAWVLTGATDVDQRIDENWINNGAGSETRAARINWSEIFGDLDLETTL